MLLPPYIASSSRESMGHIAISTTHKASWTCCGAAPADIVNPDVIP